MNKGWGGDVDPVASCELFDNSVDCTRQPENEKASKNEMDEHSFIAL